MCEFSNVIGCFKFFSTVLRYVLVNCEFSKFRSRRKYVHSLFTEAGFLTPSEKDVQISGSRWTLRKTGLDQLIRSRDAVSARSSRLFQCSLNKVAGYLVDILNWHELLVPHDLLCTIGCGYTEDVAYVFKDAKAVGNIFPEKARVFVQDDAIWYVWVLRNHRELHSRVTHVRVENPLKATRVRDLSLVHCADPLRDRYNLRQLQSGETLQKRGLNRLNLVIKNLNFMCAFFREVLIQQGHLTCFESCLPVPVLEVSVNAPWMNDLIRWRECHVQEARYGDGRDAVSEGHSAANVVNFLERIAGQVEVLLGPDDIDFFAVVESLADERDILQTEEGYVAADNLVDTAKCTLRLPVECALAEDGAKEASIRQVLLYFIDDLTFGLGRTADNDDI